jgi:hypothetical protein
MMPGEVANGQLSLATHPTMPGEVANGQLSLATQPTMLGQQQLATRPTTSGHPANDASPTGQQHLANGQLSHPANYGWPTTTGHLANKDWLAGQRYLATRRTKAGPPLFHSICIVFLPNLPHLTCLDPSRRPLLPPTTPSDWPAGYIGIRQSPSEFVAALATVHCNGSLVR